MKKEHYNIKAFYIFVLFVILTSTFQSCGKKYYPSGLEGNLIGNKRRYEQVLRQRERVAKKSNRERASLERKANRPKIRAKRKEERVHKKLVQEHINKQAPQVQARMKENQKFTKRNYSSRKSFKEKILFWKKKTHNNGFRQHNLHRNRHSVGSS